MKITKQRLKEIIKEELDEIRKEDDPRQDRMIPVLSPDDLEQASAPAPEDEDASPSALLNDITALADLADRLRKKIHYAAVRNLEQHPQVREAINALEKTKALLESIE